jgi:hypothetical protein
MKKCLCIDDSVCSDVSVGVYYFFTEGRFYNTLYSCNDVYSNRVCSIQVAMDDFELFFVIDDGGYEEVTNLFYKIMDNG